MTQPPEIDGQLDIFAADVPNGTYEAVERAARNTPCGFKEQLDVEIRALANSNSTWTTDDLRRRLPEEIDQPNQIGAAIQAASKAGIITAVGARPSEWPTTHGRLIRIWQGTRNPVGIRAQSDRTTAT